MRHHKMINYRYAYKNKKITKKELKTYSSMRQYSKEYYPNKKSDNVQEQFDDAIYNGDITKAVKILTKYHFNKLNNLLKKLVSQF